MSKAGRPKWILPAVLLVASLYVFWVLPRQLPDKPVQVEFEPATSAPAR